jgi:transposase
MGQPLSMDLRARLIAAIDDGMSCRAAAARFGVAPSTAIVGMHSGAMLATSNRRPRAATCARIMSRKRATDILALWEANRDITLEELRADLSKIGLAVSIAGLHRFFKRHGMTRKKRPAMPSNRIARTS